MARALFVCGTLFGVATCSLRGASNMSQSALQQKSLGNTEPLACHGTVAPATSSCYQGDVFGIEFLKVTFNEQGKMQMLFWGFEEGCVDAEYEYDEMTQILTQISQTGCDGGAAPPVQFVFKYCSTEDKVLLEITHPIQHQTYLSHDCGEVTPLNRTQTKQALVQSTPEASVAAIQRNNPTVADQLTCVGSDAPDVSTCYEGDVFGLEFLEVTFEEQGKMQILFSGFEEGCVNAEYKFEEATQILTQTNETGCDGGAAYGGAGSASTFVFKYCSAIDKVLLEITQPIQHQTYLAPTCGARRLATDIIL